MNEWRDRGYVLDSDDEELGLSDTHDSPVRNDGTQHGNALEELNDVGGTGQEEGTASHGQEQPVPSIVDQNTTTTEHCNHDPTWELLQETGAIGSTLDDEDQTKRLSQVQKNAGSEDAVEETPIINVHPQEPSQHNVPQQPGTHGGRAYIDDSPPSTSLHKGIRTYGRRDQTLNMKQTQDRSSKHTTASPTDLGRTVDHEQDGLHAQLSGQPSQTSTTESLPKHIPQISNDTTEHDTLAPRRTSVSSSDLSDVDMDILSSSPNALFFRSAPSGYRPMTDGSLSSQVRTPTAMPTAEQRAELREALRTGDFTQLSVPLRTFRARKAIQLHPYLIESEQYRKTLRARGVRPVHVATDSQTPRNGANDTQDVEFRNEESQMRSHTQETTPPDSSESSQQPAAIPDPERAAVMDMMDMVGDDFPDLDVALRRHVIGGVQKGYKRRKTNETLDSRDEARCLPSSTAHARGKLKSLRLRPHSSVTSSVSGMPPSPPRTSSPSNLDPLSTTTPGFRLPRGIIPAAIETPIVSSLERRLGGSSVGHPQEIDTQSDRSDDGQDEAESDVSSSASSDAEKRQILRMRKRIRGVLPASWLKLDRKTQRKPSTPAPSGTHLEVTPQQPALLRGIAQRRITSASTTPAARRQTLIISDNSDDSDSSSKKLPTSHVLQRRNYSPEQRLLRPFDNDVDGEVLEYDEIDDMFPAASRPRVKKGRSTKRQSRLTDAFLQPSDLTKQTRRVHSGAKPVPHQSRKMQSKPKETVKRKPRRKQAPHLSILDASHEGAQTQTVRRPQFVRVAARQARQRPDYGRHSPTQKTVRLATWEDTHDALAPLRKWQAGGLSRSWQPTAHDSPPGAAQADAETRPVFPRKTGFRLPRGIPDAIGDGQDQPDDQESVADSMQNRRAAVHHANTDDTTPSTGRPSSAQTGLTAASGLPNQSSRRTKRIQTKKVQAKPHGMLERTNHLRPAQLEGVATHSRNDYDMLTFAPPPSRLMELFNRDRVARPADFRLERFLQDRGDLPVDAHATNRPVEDQTTTEEFAQANAKPAPRRRLKQRARRFDVELANYRQPSEPLPAEITFEPADDVAVINNVETLQGLSSFGVRYATDFDVRPLEIGTYFHQSTFVGSGDFQDSLTLRGRDLDTAAGRIIIDVQGESLKWSAWDEDVSTGLTAILSTCSSGLQALSNTTDYQERETILSDVANVVRYLLRSLVRFCSGCLYFFDPIDRTPCIAQFSRFLDEFSEMIDEQVFELRQRNLFKETVEKLVIDSVLYLLSLSGQLSRIAHHPAVESTIQKTLSEKTVRLSRKVIDFALPGTLTIIRSFIEKQRQHAIRDAGVRDDQTAATAVVVVNHVLKGTPTSTTLADILADRQTRGIEKSCNIQFFDQAWYDIFTIQPLLEIDAQGIFRAGSRFQNANDNWTVVKFLLDRLFTLYPSSAQTWNASLNDYVRACLTRGYHLMTRWGWHKCERLLNTVYDFFAKNGLSQLVNEEGRGSARFLEELDKDPTVHVEAGDCAFHIFLKLLVVGLQGMKNIYKERQIRGIAWRFIPNHGRTHRKDQDVTQASLDALRNHHDLLCTLYWILPPGSGPRLDVIKDLVDHTTSHREACRLSVRAWGILAKYQLSREEEFKDLDSLASWFKDMMTSTISQYRLARSEAETQYAAENSKGFSPDLSPEVLEMTIASNQRGIVATLLDLLQALQQALSVAKKWETACKLVHLVSVVEVFRLFDPDQPRLLIAVSYALDIISKLLTAQTEVVLSQATDSQRPSEESQDYGEWSFMEEAVNNEESSTKTSEVGLTDFLHEPLANLLSSCFGSEKSPDDDLLKKLVDVWTKLAGQTVVASTHDWSNYLDAYSTNSWFQLRSTEQKSKFTPYFLSSVIQADVTCFTDHRALFLGAWLVSLLGRESMLKYQHILTTSLLNNYSFDPLLHNLPFASSRDGHYSVSLTDLRSRRLSLISSILSNMRIHLESSSSSDPTADLRRTYTNLLKQAQSAMRSTYQDLHSICATSGASIQSSYVIFVQSTISLLQQHTSDICPIDAFFVDSTAFPLPAHDPAYVVGRLKAYVSKLADPRARKQLAVFVQTVSERAAVDGLQPYLVTQIHAALTGPGSAGLRHVLCTAILPAYIECGVTTPSGWVLASPLVEAVGLVFADLIYELSGTGPGEEEELAGRDAQSLSTVLTALLSSLTSLARRAVVGQSNRSCIGNPSLLRQPQNLRAVTQAFGAARASLTAVEWLHKTSTTPLGKHSEVLIRRFVALGEHLWDHVREPTPARDDNGDASESSSEVDDFEHQLDLDLDLDDDVDPQDQIMQAPYTDTLEFSRKNLLDELARAWVRREGRVGDDNDDGQGGDEYFISRGSNSTREVVVRIGGVREERNGAREAIKGFMVAYDAVFRLRGVCRDVIWGREGVGGEAGVFL